MFVYPEHAAVNRILPKNKIYGHAQPSRALRQHFISDVEQIVWRFKLAPETLHLPIGVGVEEIQVFEIALRTAELPENLLRVIDRAIPSRLFFELSFQGKVRFAAAYKRPNESGAEQPVVESYYLTPWRLVDSPRLPLPAALNLGILYEKMLREHMKASPLALCGRSGESLGETAVRGDQILAQRRSCQKLEMDLRRETQFNRKVEINAALRLARSELARLERPIPSASENPPVAPHALPSTDPAPAGPRRY